MSVEITEPAPYSGELRIKAWWISEDYERMVKLFLGRVDARGQLVYNLTKDGGDTYCWKEIDPNWTQNQITPLLSLEQGMIGPLYKSLLDHLIRTGFMAPPSTTAAEDVERKMLISENEFLKDLITTLAGTRKKESWHTTLTRDQNGYVPTEELQKAYIQIENELTQRIGTQIRAGTPITYGATGSTGHGQPGLHSESRESYGQGSTLIPLDTPSDFEANDGEWANYSASRQRHSEDRG